MNYKAIINGAVSGFVAALLVDLHAWQASKDQFDWVLAIKRWIAGAISGALAGAGLAA